MQELWSAGPAMQLTRCAKVLYLLDSGPKKESRAEVARVNWKGIDRHHIELKKPLLLLKGSKGWLGCGYFNAETCNKTGEACAIVTGVATYDDMLAAEIKAVSDAAKSLGISVGMKGAEALEILR